MIQFTTDYSPYAQPAQRLRRQDLEPRVARKGQVLYLLYISALWHELCSVCTPVRQPVTKEITRQA
jgi:hypothetical protein